MIPMNERRIQEKINELKNELSIQWPIGQEDYELVCERIRGLEMALEIVKSENSKKPHKPDIDWEEKAKEFLENHGWVFEENWGFHNCYPLGEEFIDGKEQFCNEFYGEAWQCYKKYVEIYVVWYRQERGDE